MRRVELDHESDECLGRWVMHDAEYDSKVQCDRCGRTYPYQPDIRLAAIDENYAAIYLRRLADEGSGLLAQDREPWSKEGPE